MIENDIANTIPTRKEIIVNLIKEYRDYSSNYRGILHVVVNSRSNLFYSMARLEYF